MARQNNINVHSLKVERTTQLEADKWLRKLFSSKVEIAQDAALSFSDEKGHRESGQPVWALPEIDRTYFLVSTGENPLLLAGVNSHCGISSFMKLEWGDKYRGVGRRCVQALIETELVKLCKERGKAAFSVHTATKRSWRVFRQFVVELPKGIKRVEPTTAGFTLYIA